MGFADVEYIRSGEKTQSYVGVSQEYIESAGVSMIHSQSKLSLQYRRGKLETYIPLAPRSMPRAVRRQFFVPNTFPSPILLNAARLNSIYKAVQKDPLSHL